MVTEALHDLTDGQQSLISPFGQQGNWPFLGVSRNER